MSAILTDRLSVLRQRFLEGLERRLDEMSSMLDGPADEDALMRMFHSVAGIAGTYGYHEITEISRGCELLCAAALEVCSRLTEAEAASLRDGVGAMRARAASVR
jgi:chemotaxis protein histidine kinase CheA